MRRRTGPTPRMGYTLVELLIVIAIIAILAALLTSAISRVRQTAKKTTAVHEINQLDMALTSFQNKHGFNPPSHVGYTVGTTQFVGLFRIPQQVYDPTATTTPGAVPSTPEQWREYASLNILRRMFPRWNPGVVGGPVTVTTPSGPQPLFVPTINGTPVRDLDPNQSMVYFLGGPGTLGGPSSGLNPGWDTAQPMAPTGNTRIDPYYSEFSEARLKDESGAFTGTAGTFDGRYRDPWGIPYAYFVANSGSDQYDPRLQFPWPATQANAAPLTFDPAADPNNGDKDYGALAGAKTNTVHPLATAVTGTNIRWFNPKKFQIISAGPDGVFGRGTYRPASGNPPPEWKPGVGNGYAEGEKGEDDLANFNNGTALGATGTGS